jgi:hypothetical protein
VALARKKPIPRTDPSGPDEPNVVFTREIVGQLAAEIGVFDEQKIDELLEIFTKSGWWCFYDILDQKIRPPLVRKRLCALKQKAGELLEQINGLDHETRCALASGFRRCRRRNDPRVRHIDPRLVIGAWLTIGAVRDLVDLLHDAAQGAIEVTPTGDGRPSRRSLRQACLHLAQVYEDFTGKKFTREKGRGVWTDSAHWVAKVATMLTPKGEPSPSGSELNTAMRYAVRDLRDRPNVPWLDEDSIESRDLQKPPS